MAAFVAAPHRRPAPSWQPLAFKERDVLVRHNVFFRSAVLSDCHRNLWARRKMHE
jgi:hypothetical protein